MPRSPTNIVHTYIMDILARYCEISHTFAYITTRVYIDGERSGEVLLYSYIYE